MPVCINWEENSVKQGAYPCLKILQFKFKIWGTLQTSPSHLHGDVFKALIICKECGIFIP